MDLRPGLQRKWRARWRPGTASCASIRTLVAAWLGAAYPAYALAQGQGLTTRLAPVAAPVLIEELGPTEVARQRPDAVYGWIDKGLREPVDFSQRRPHPTLTVTGLSRHDRSLCIEIHRADGSYQARAEVEVAPAASVVELPLDSSQAARALMSRLPAVAGELALRVRAAPSRACASKGPWLPARWGVGRVPEPRYLGVGASSLGVSWIRVEGAEAVPCEPLAQAIGRIDLGGVVFSSLCPVYQAPSACSTGRKPLNAKILWMRGERQEAEANIRLIASCHE